MEEVKKTLEDMASPELFTEYEREQLEEYCQAYGRFYERKEGRKEGIEIGEKNKATEIAKSLLQQKVTDTIILNATGLSIEELQKLKEEI